MMDWFQAAEISEKQKRQIKMCAKYEEDGPVDMIFSNKVNFMSCPAGST